jgi:hypothetical protein
VKPFWSLSKHVTRVADGTMVLLTRVLPSDARHRGDIYLYHFKRWEANDPAPLPAGSVGNFKAGVETSGRSVFIVLSDDTGKEFVKAGG